MNRVINKLLIFIIGLSIVLAAVPIVQGVLDFNTDIARDFLLLEDVYFNKNITLLGPRSGGIPGVFHGPLWIYLNLPAYILGNGNPTAVGWFWMLLFIASIYFVYKAGKEIFDTTTGLVAAAVFATAAAGGIHAMFNPFGATMLFPIYFYFFYRYAKNVRFLDLIISLFILGLVIQFQMAFGGPLLIISLLYALWIIIKEKKYSHILAAGILIIPFSTYIVFELRNNFLQIHSVLNYLNGKENLGKVDQPFIEMLGQRLNYMIYDTLSMITMSTLWLSFFTVFITIYAISKNFKLKKDNPYVLFLLFLVGYWFLTIFYKGVIWNYYYSPFIGVVAIFFASGHKHLQKFFWVITAIVLLSNFYNNYKRIMSIDPKGGTWYFFSSAAEKVYKDAPSEFGFYIYTTDLYGYSSRYAMNYMDRKYTDKSGVPYTKKKDTYLLIDDPGDNKVTNHKDWKKYDLHIEREPNEKEQLRESYSIEHYVLTDDELKVGSNPDLIQTLIFR